MKPDFRRPVKVGRPNHLVWLGGRACLGAGFSERSLVTVIEPDSRACYTTSAPVAPRANAETRCRPCPQRSPVRWIGLDQPLP